MSTTLELQPVLRYLADHPDKSMDFIAGKFQVQKKDIWDWLTLHNRGQKELSHTRIDSALAGPVKAKPAATVKADDSARNEKPKPQPRQPLAAMANPTFERPWLALRFRRDGFKSWRDALVRMADTPTATLVELCEGDKGRAMAFAAYKRGQLGAGEVCAEAVRALIAYGDAKLARDEAPEPSAPKPEKIPRVRVDTILEIGRPQHKLTPVAPVSPADWIEIKLGCGGRKEYAARYTGSSAKVPRISFTIPTTATLREFGFETGKRVQAFWQPKARQLAFKLGTSGFKIRAGRANLAIGSKALVDVLGQDAIEFEQLKPVKGFDLVLGERGGAL